MLMDQYISVRATQSGRQGLASAGIGTIASMSAMMIQIITGSRRDAFTLFIFGFGFGIGAGFGESFGARRGFRFRPIGLRRFLLRLRLLSLSAGR